jgi:predicted RNA polymerase sigma factor
MSDVAKTIEAVWKIESTRLIAAIARVTHDIGIAEELARDALVTALEVWPEEGIPDNPGACLMKAANRWPHHGGDRACVSCAGKGGLPDFQ